MKETKGFTTEQKLQYWRTKTMDLMFEITEQAIAIEQHRKEIEKYSKEYKFAWQRIQALEKKL